MFQGILEAVFFLYKQSYLQPTHLMAQNYKVFDLERACLKHQRNPIKELVNFHPCRSGSSNYFINLHRHQILQCCNYYQEYQD